MHTIAQKFSALRAELKSQFLERDDAIEACLLALVTGQHVLMLGQPGLAKSQLIRAIMSALRGHRYFEVGLNRNLPMEAVVGPLDILHFRATGEYRYKREGYATACEFIMLNEIGKMSDELGHSLLALLNERLIFEVDENGSSRPAPLSTAFCDSNEELTTGSDQAAALDDRLLVRVEVKDLAEDTNFAKMLVMPEPEITTEITWAELREVIESVIPTITIPDHVQQAMVTLRRELAEEGIRPSPRRFHWSMTVLRGAAFLAGRDEVTEDDIANLRFTLWGSISEIQTVDRLCRSKANPFVGPLLGIRERLHELKDGVEKRHKDFVDNGSDWDSQYGSSLQLYGREVSKKCEEVRTELDAMLLEAGGRPIPTFKAISDLQQAILVQNYQITLGQSHESARKMAGEPKRIGQDDGGNV